MISNCVCGARFTKTNNRLFCSSKCKRESVYVIRNCICGQEYSTNDRRVWHCSLKCKQLSKNSKYPKGYYVYVWKNKDETLPFYVGSGIQNRAWLKHTLNGILAKCEELRTADTEIIIVKDGLDKKESLASEYCLIKLLVILGASLSNNT